MTPAATFLGRITSKSCETSNSGNNDVRYILSTTQSESGIGKHTFEALLVGSLGFRFFIKRWSVRRKNKDWADVLTGGPVRGNLDSDQAMVY